MTRPDAAAPAAGDELQRWSLGEQAHLSEMRASLHQALIDHALVGDERDADVADDVVLVATELAANALYHAMPPTTVRLLRDETRFVLDVADQDPATMPQIVAASLTRERGRGLFIAHAMAQQVGWYLTGTAKHVWAAFPITDTGPHESTD